MNWPLSRFIKLPGRVAVLEGRVCELEAKLAALLSKDAVEFIGEQGLQRVIAGLRIKISQCPEHGRRGQLEKIVDAIVRTCGNWLEEA